MVNICYAISFLILLGFTYWVCFWQGWREKPGDPGMTGWFDWRGKNGSV